MHQPTATQPHTPDADAYEWPLCTAGPTTGPHAHHLWAEELDRLVCRPCEDQTRRRLTELPALFAKLDRTAMLMKGASPGGTPTAGTRTAPIPPRLDVLNLTSPGGIPARLQAIEDSWRQALGWPTPPPTAPRHVFPVWRDQHGARHTGQPVRGDRVYPYWRTDRPADVVPRCVTFLTNNILWACSSYTSVADDIHEIRRLHSQCKALVENKPRTGQVKIGLCPVQGDLGPCGTQLTATTNSFTTRCPECGTAWEGREEWQQLRKAQNEAHELAGAAA